MKISFYGTGATEYRLRFVKAAVVMTGYQILWPCLWWHKAGQNQKKKGKNLIMILTELYDLEWGR
jgi:hypothetical protein